MKCFNVKLPILIFIYFYVQKSLAIDLNDVLHSLGDLIGKKSLCEPNRDCATAGTEGSLVQDPEDCHNYYVCVRVDEEIIASGSPLSCPEGQFFNSDTLTCEVEIQPCVNSCDGICTLTCSGDVDLVPIPGNCSAYGVCLIGGDTQPEACPSERPYFNGLDCTTDSSLCCDFCNLNCNEIGVQIPDPCDCQKYYICQTLGVPSESLHETCLDGGHFDPNLGNCVSGSSCQPICTSDFCSNSYSTIPSTYITTTPSTATTTTILSTPSTPFISTTNTPEITTTIPPIQTTTSEAETTSNPSTSFGYCSESMSCIRTGYYRVCTYCTSVYYVCSKLLDQAEIAYCPEGQVFNPDPLYPFCLDINDCPYPGS